MLIFEKCELICVVNLNVKILNSAFDLQILLYYTKTLKIYRYLFVRLFSKITNQNERRCPKRV